MGLQRPRCRLCTVPSHSLCMRLLQLTDTIGDSYMEVTAPAILSMVDTESALSLSVFDKRAVTTTTTIVTSTTRSRLPHGARVCVGGPEDGELYIDNKRRIN